jgi:uncharacterized protein DUF5677
MDQEAHIQSESYFNFLMLIEQRYREVFIPPLQSIMFPTEFEKLLMFQAYRVLKLFDAMKQLKNYKYMHVHINLLRTCFEIAIEVELLTHPEELFPESKNPEESVLERCRVLKQRMMIKEWYILKKCPNVSLSKYAKEKCEENEKLVADRETEVFGKVSHNRSHWWNDTLKDRIEKLDTLINNQNKFKSWHEYEYRQASQFVHGAMTPWNSLDCYDFKSKVISGVTAMFFPWGAEVICNHIMKPIWRYLKLADSNEDAFKDICDSVFEAARLCCLIQNGDIQKL